MSYWNGHAEGMSSGLHFANIASSQADDAIASWQQHSANLERRLQRAEKALATAENELNFRRAQSIAGGAAWKGEEAVSKQLYDAIAMMEPQHPYVEDPAILAGIRSSEATKFAAQNGYEYNANTRGVTKKG